MEVTNPSAAREETDDEKEDIYSLENSIRAELNSLPPLSSSSSIYRFPSDVIKHVTKGAYIPQFVSIGPLHHGKKGLEVMEEHKKRYLHDFLCRTETNQLLVNSLKDYIMIIRSKEQKLRSYYAEPVGFTSDEFAKIVLVDAAFIIECLLRLQFNEDEREGDRIMNKPWMLAALLPDLMMLENQLPFFILEDLLKEHSAGRLSMIVISEALIDLGTMYYGVGENKKWEKIATQSSSMHVQHFVDLSRTFYLPLESELKARSQLKNNNILSITELHQAGVKFKAGPTENMIDIKFADGILEIPKMIISPYALWNLGNLIAYESCHCRYENYMSDYVIMLRRLVTTPKDVELLIKEGILESYNTDCEASNEINKLASQAGYNPANFYYGEICNDLRKHYRSPWNRWKANLKQNYFNTPWASISVIGASVLLILTLIQTVCSILSVTFDKHSK